MKKRVLSAVMALVMLTTMLPVQALAAELDSATEKNRAAQTDSASQTVTAASAAVEFVPVDETDEAETDESAATPEVPQASETPVAETSAAPASDVATQADDSTSGTTADGFTYTTSNGAVTITKYTGTATEITIPNTIDGTTVTAIGASAFSGSETLSKITLPNTIQTIGAYAFINCTALSSINLPEGLTSIYAYAFQGCTALTSLTVPSTLTTAYSYTNALHGFLTKSCVKTLTLADGFTTIPTYLCDGANNLTEIIWPKSTITTIEDKAFSYCTALENITLPGSVTKIGYQAFWYCTSLKSVKLPSSLTTLGNEVFLDCKALKSVEVPSGVTSISDYAFKNCTALESVTLPSGLTSIGAYAFDVCSALTSVTMPDSVTTLSKYAFASCAGLTSIKLSENITSIEEHTFYKCTALSSIELPSSLTKICYRAFFGCTALTNIEPPSGLTSIGQEAFSGCTSLSSVILPDSVTSIGDKGFNGCTALKSVTMPKVETIGISAFNGCTELTNIELPEGLKTINEDSFGNCTSLKSLTIPASLETATNTTHGPLRGSGITTITFAEGTTNVPKLLCDAVKSLTTVNWPKSNTVETIGERAFALCTSLTSIDLPGSVATIGKEAFDGCTALESIVIPKSVASIGASAFSGCTSLTLYTELNSYGTIYAIDNDKPFVADVSTPLVSDILNRSKTRYYFDTGSINTNGCLPFTVVVSIPEETFATLNSPKVTIRIPTGATLQADSIKVNGDPLIGDNAYTYSSPKLTIPLTEAESTIQFYAKVSDASKLASYAKLTATDVDELIGVVNEPAVGLSIVGPEYTSSTSVTLSGIAPVGATITLTQNGSSIGTVTANKAGTWSCAVTLPSTDETLYTFAASCTADGTSYSADCQVYYEESTPTVTAFTLQVEGHGMQTIDLLDCAKNNTTPKVGYYLTCPEYRFDITFENAESLDKVYVTSTKNGVKKVMDATYDESVGHYVAEGYFDDENHSYMPGDIRVEYNLKTETQKVDKNFNVTQYNDDKVTATGKVSEDNKKVEGTIDLKGLGEDLKEKGLEYSLEWYDNSYGTTFKDLYDSASLINGLYAYAIDGIDDKKYYATLDFSEPTTYTMIISDSLDIADSIYSFKVSAAEYTAGSAEFVSLFDTASVIGSLSKGVGLVEKGLKIVKDTDELRDDILRSSMSYGDKQIALGKADELKYDRLMFVLATTALPALASSGVALTGTAVMAGPAIVFSAIVGIMGIAASQIWELRMAQIKGDACSVDWYMDPSGYVLDADTDKPVVNAKMTAFYIPNDNSETFYDRVLSESDYGSPEVKEWVAADYGQNNPIYTDGNGWYKWDVPEGWWYVVCEKDGYEKMYSGWMPVAPPQTDVNFSLKRIYDLGDVNGNGEMDAIDLQCLYEYLTTDTYNGNTDTKSEITGWADWETLMMDINCDGSIDVYDLQRLYEAVSGIDPLKTPDQAA